jgi:dihydrofolate reductase
MTNVIVGMTVSIDGFAADRNGSAGPLYPDLEELRNTDHMQTMIRETGAVLMGKRAFEMGDPDSYVGTYELQVPIFVVTHEPPTVAPKQDEHLTFTFVTDGLESALAQATRAAGDRAVMVIGGVTVARDVLAAGLADELHIDVMPVLLGAGRRLFDEVDLSGVRLEKLGVDEVGARTSLAFRLQT